MIQVRELILQNPIQNLKDGRNYFHVKAHNNVGWGGVATYEINVDTTAPYPFGIAKVLNDKGDKFIIYFATNDSFSGVDHFTVKVDGVDKGRQSTAYVISSTVNTIEVNAFDKAGNKRTEKETINEASISDETPVSDTVSTPDTRTIVFVIAIIAGVILIASLLIFAYIKYKKSRKSKAILPSVK